MTDEGADGGGIGGGGGGGGGVGLPIALVCRVKRMSTSSDIRVRCYVARLVEVDGSGILLLDDTLAEWTGEGRWQEMMGRVGVGKGMSLVLRASMSGLYVEGVCDANGMTPKM